MRDSHGSGVNVCSTAFCLPKRKASSQYLWFSGFLCQKYTYILKYFTTKYSERKLKKNKPKDCQGQQIFRGTLHNYNIRDTCIHLKKNPCTAYRWKVETSFMQLFRHFQTSTTNSICHQYQYVFVQPFFPILCMEKSLLSSATLKTFVSLK